MSKLRAVIFGATGGIGAALVAELEQSGLYGEIYAGGRSLPKAAQAGTTPFHFDLTDEASIEQAAQAIGTAGPIDLVIIATGILHDPKRQMPEKSWRVLDGATMAEVFAINTVGPAIIAKHFLPLMRRDRRAVFVALSARVGSIGDNRLGGWHSYRASKAALNMLFQNFAIEFAVRHPQGVVATIHPGTVDTPLSSPFQAGVSADALFDPRQSAAHIIAVLERLSPVDSGKLFSWSGERIAF